MILGAAAWVGLGLTLVGRGAWFSGRNAVVAGRGTVGIGRASGGIAAAWPAGSEWPQWQFAGTSARIVVAPGAAWRPSGSNASITIGPVSSGLGVIWVPLWWPGVILVTAWVGLRWASGRADRPGHCRVCGYDTRGLAGCPECGDGAGAEG